VNEAKMLTEPFLKDFKTQSERNRSRSNENSSSYEDDVEDDGAYYPGSYEILVNARVKEKIILNSKKIGNVEAGDVVDIAEIRELEIKKRIRGRLVEGGWITIKRTDNGKEFARPEYYSDSEDEDDNGMPGEIESSSGEAQGKRMPKTRTSTGWYIGDRIKVVKPFMSDSTEPIEFTEGTLLAIENIDEEGDVLVRFLENAYQENEWISQDDLYKLKRLDGNVTQFDFNKTRMFPIGGQTEEDSKEEKTYTKLSLNDMAKRGK